MPNRGPTQTQPQDKDPNRKGRRKPMQTTPDDDEAQGEDLTTLGAEQENDEELDQDDADQDDEEQDDEEQAGGQRQ